MDATGIAVSCVNAMDRELEGYYKVPYWDVLKQIARARELYPDRFVLFCGIEMRRQTALVSVHRFVWKCKACEKQFSVKVGTI
jgi:transposase-like protein